MQSRRYWCGGGQHYLRARFLESYLSGSWVLRLYACLLFLSASLAGQEEPLRLKLDEQGVDLFYSATGIGNKCLLVFDVKAKPLPVTRLYLYDFDLESGFYIEDGRIDGATLAMSYGAGFVLSTLVIFDLPKSFLLNSGGGFVDAIRFDEFKNWPQEMAIIHRYGIDAARTMIGYEKPTFEKPAAEDVFLGIVHMDNKTFEEVFVIHKRDPENLVWWAPLGDNFVLLDANTGAVDLYQGAAFKKKNILPRMPIRDSPSLAKFKKLGKNISMVPTHLRRLHYLSNVIVQDRSITLRRKTIVDDKQGIDYGYTIHMDGSFERTRGSQLIWLHKKKEIHLNFTSRELSLVQK